MSMTNHVTSLEVSKKLKEVGWKKETEFWWITKTRINSGDGHSGWYKEEVKGIFELSYGKQGYVNSVRFPAPLATELLEELPINSKGGYNLTMYKYDIGYYAGYADSKNEDCIANTLPNALAKMYLYLTKKGLIKCQ